jgi:hypothetical protein
MLTSWILILESHGASGTYGAVAEVILVFEYILKEYEDQVYNEASEDHVAINLKTAWAKLNDYYNKLNDSPAYYAATILYPRYKKFCDVVWADKPARLHRNNKAFNTLWAQYNAPRARFLATMPAAHCSNDINDVIDNYINPEQSGGTNSELDEY